MSESNSNGDVARSLLYQTVQPYLLYCQLMCGAPYPVESLQQNVSSDREHKPYFKLARFLLTSLVLSYVISCCSSIVLGLIDVPMPFFTGVLYVFEAVLGMLISLLTTVRSYGQGKQYDRFLETVLTVGSALQPPDWKNILTTVQCRMRFVTSGVVTVFVLCIICDYAHHKSLQMLLFSLGGYMLPNMLVALSFLQCCFGVLLIYCLLQTMRQRVGAAELTRCDTMQRVTETERQYLQLIACMELITRSFELLIVVNTFAGINVTSLQLLEIYQHLHEPVLDQIYVTYCLLWIGMQLFALLMILYPYHLVKREQCRLGLMMFQISQHGDDARVESKIARFGLLTLNRKDVAYMANGILKLELSSLSSIFVALLSFMIILIQFDSANFNKHQGAITTMDTLYSSMQ